MNPRVQLIPAAGPFPISTLARRLTAALRALTRRPVTVAVILVDDRTIRRLNRKFLGHDYATDVITFPTTGKSKVKMQKAEATAVRGGRTPAKPGGSLLLPSDFFLLTSPDLLGEVYVSVTTARREAKARGIPFEEELLRYAVHGMLHLFGYDDGTPARRKRMWARQEGLVAETRSPESQPRHHRRRG